MIISLRGAIPDEMLSPFGTLSKSPMQKIYQYVVYLQNWRGLSAPATAWKEGNRSETSCGNVTLQFVDRKVFEMLSNYIFHPKVHYILKQKTFRWLKRVLS